MHCTSLPDLKSQSLDFTSTPPPSLTAATHPQLLKMEDIEPIGNAANPLQMRELEDVKEQLLQSNPVLEAFGKSAS